MSEFVSFFPVLKRSSIELGLVSLSLLVLTIDLFRFHRKGRTILTVSVIGLLALLGHLFFHAEDLIGNAFGGFYTVSFLDLVFKGIFITASLFIILMVSSKHLIGFLLPGEAVILVLLATTGACFVASSGEFLTLFISLEIMAFSAYILTAYPQKNQKSSEAGLKYLILGSISSAFLLFGIVLLFGLTGSTEFTTIQSVLPEISSPLIWISFLLILVGIGFKMGIFPFQFWIPDVYQGAPTWVGGFLSVVSKAAGFAAFSKLYFLIGEPLGEVFLVFWGFLTILTVIYGNFGACIQDNLKRLLGYSSIAHAGYLALALLNPEPFGWKSVTFYFIVYLFSNLLVFLCVFLADPFNDERLGLKGLHQRSSLLTTGLFIGLASLAGLPPTGGFIGKIFLFFSAFQAKAFLALGFALVGVLVSLYYYFRVIRETFFESQDPATKALPLELSPLATFTIVTLILGVVLLGVYPFPIIRILF